jgi:hypothetical protein
VTNATRRNVVTGILAVAVPVAAVAATVAVDPMQAAIAAARRSYERVRQNYERIERLRAELVEAEAESEALCRDANDACHVVENTTPTTHEGYKAAWRFFEADELNTGFEPEVLLRLGTSFAKLA